MRLIRTSEFAATMGLSDRSVRDIFKAAHQGKPWRGMTLPIVEVAGEKGGASGRVKCLIADELPPALRASFDASSNALQTSSESLFKDHTSDGAAALASWRWSIIRDVYRLPPSPERTAEIDRIVSQKHHFQGRDTTVSKTTVYEWIKRYAEGGFGALAPSPRADRGVQRVLMTRQWDKKIDLPDDAKNRIAAAMEAYAKQFLRSDGSLRKLEVIGSRRLAELCVEAGSAHTPDDLTKICKLNAKWTGRYIEFKRVARKDRDAKLHFDHDQPRISRHGPALPGQIIFGDVHPGDLLVLDANKEQIRVRLIAWQDACTHMLHLTPVLLRKGRGIRQSDVADSFWDLTCDPQFGLPGTLYLDNGGEYGSLFGAFQNFPDLSMIVPGRGVIKAKPYNGPAKGLIEGAFSGIERQFMKHLPGYIGGDRTNKKTQSVGKPPAPYNGTYSQLLDQLEEVAAMYNDTAQSGLLKGQSPRQALAIHVKSGWAATTMDAQSFDFVFSTRKAPMVSQGGFKCKGQRYFSDEIAKLGHGEYLDVRIPLRTSTVGVRVFHEGRDLGTAYPDVSYSTTDPAGAIEAARRQKIQNAQISALRKEAGKELDLHAETLRFTDTSPVATEFGQVISIANENGFQTAEQLATVEQAERAKQDQAWEDLLRYTQSEKREAGGGNRQPLRAHTKKE